MAEIIYRRRRVVQSDDIQCGSQVAPFLTPAPILQSRDDQERRSVQRKQKTHNQPFDKKKTQKKKHQPLHYKIFPKNSIERKLVYAIRVQPLIPMRTKRDRAAEQQRQFSIKEEIRSFPVFQQDRVLPLARNIHSEICKRLYSRRVLWIRARTGFSEFGLSRLHKARLELDVQRVLKQYTRKDRYLCSLVSEEHRFNLDAQEDGWVYTTEKRTAEALLQRRGKKCAQSDGENNES